MKELRRANAWRDVADEAWDNWKWQLAHRITDVRGLAEVIELAEEEAEALDKSLNLLRMAITPYYASLMDPRDPGCPVRMQAVPTLAETYAAPEDLLDPLHEDSHSPVHGLTHRYPDRCIMLVTDQCSMYCRHCTRRRFAGETDQPMPRKAMEACLDYIRRTPVIRDVLVTGGDPLTLEDTTLEWLLGELRAIPHVEVVRLGTRVPAVLPQRVTPELCSMLKRFHPLWINVHFNHPRELTEEAGRALEMLADSGIPMGNQSVLLKGINDCPYIFRELNQALLRHRVRPYYIYQCDLSQGISHFRTAVSKGIEVVEFLRGHTSGMAVPTFVVDAPGGGGKIPVMPQYLVSQSDRKVLLRNFEGVITSYTEPEDDRSRCHENCHDICSRQKAFSREGLASLFEGDTASLEPRNLARNKRRHQSS